MSSEKPILEMCKSDKVECEHVEGEIVASILMVRMRVGRRDGNVIGADGGGSPLRFLELNVPCDDGW